MSSSYLTNQFLISMPQLTDQNFYQSVMLICQHDENGALGIIINKQTDYTLADIYKQLEIQISADGIDQIPVFDGGPVHQEFGLVIHEHSSSDDWQSTLRISDSLSLTSSRDILEDIACGSGPDKCLMSLGYAGWGPNQLEQEILDNSWLSTPVEERIIFDSGIEDKWHRAAQLIGVDLNRLADHVGHA